jgi:DNA-binding NtrC family response regulator
MPFRVIVVDEQDQFLKTLVARLEREGFEVTGILVPEDALGHVQRNDVHVAILGDPDDGRSVLNLLQEIKRAKPMVQVILLALRGSVECSIQAMKLGASDFLSKPTDVPDLVEKIKAAKAERRKKKVKGA